MALHQDYYQSMFGQGQHDHMMAFTTEDGALQRKMNEALENRTAATGIFVRSSIIALILR